MSGELDGAAPQLLVAAITPEDLGRIPHAPSGGPEASGADAARAAAEDGAGAGDEPSAGPSSAPPSGEAAVLFVDMVLVLGVQLAASRYKVPARDCAALARLTPDERALLAQFAPYAAPYLGAVGEASPVVGALAFAGVALMIVAGRFRDVRAAAPPSSARSSPRTSTGASSPAAAQTVSREPPPAGARAVDLQHLATWGPASDVVPPGTQVVDSGKFPEPPASA